MTVAFLFGIQNCGNARAARADHEGQSTALAMKISELRCGEVLITISTIQEQVDVNTGQAVSQIIRFIHQKKTRFVVLVYENQMDSDSMIVEAACALGKEGRHFVSFTSTNFGFCDECGWADYYTERGEYLGSNQKPYLFGARNFDYRELPRHDEFLERLFSTHALTSTVEIGRTYP